MDRVTQYNTNFRKGLQAMSKRQALRQRQKAIRTLRGTGLTDAEIEAALGYPLKEPENRPERLRTQQSVRTDVENVEPEGRADVIDAEVVDIEEETDPPHEQVCESEPIDIGEQTNAASATAVASLPVPVAGLERNADGSLKVPPRYSEEWWARQSAWTQSRRCRGHKKTGERCKQLAMEGGTVCRFHGGAARHVRAAARARLDNAADRMAKHLLRLGESAESETVQLGATNSALDRSGIVKPAQVEIGPMEPKPYELIFESIAGGSREESRARRGYVAPEQESGEPEASRAEHGEPTQRNPDMPTQPPQPTQRNGGQPTPPADQGHQGGWSDDAWTSASGLGNPDTDARGPSRQRKRRDREPASAGEQDRRSWRDRQRASERRHQGMHATDEQAIGAARRANEASGALPGQRAIESRHKRYPRP